MTLYKRARYLRKQGKIPDFTNEQLQLAGREFVKIFFDTLKKPEDRIIKVGQWEDGVNHLVLSYPNKYRDHIDLFLKSWLNG